MIYNAFGVTLSSDIPLSPLLKVKSCTENIDIAIQRRTVNPQGLLAPNIIKPNSQSAYNELWFYIPNVARFYVANSNTVHVQPDPGADDDSIRLFLLGTCMGALMHQRQRLVIHGNAIRIGDECIILAGLSGNGKSTLAAAFHQQGYELLSDDLAVLDKHLQVQPSYPQIKLWQDTADKLGIDTTHLQRIRYQYNKYAYPLQPDQFCNTPLPVRAIYILSTHNQDSIEFTPITGADKFIPLKNQTYRYGQLEGFGLKSQHLKLCANLANKTPLTRITRPKNGCDLNRLVELIESDLRKASCAA